MPSKQKILITGVAGFIGSNLADRLIHEGHSVLGIDNLSYGIREQVPEGVEFHRLDIRDADIYPVFAGADIVFHLAAKNSLIDCQNDPVGTMDNNVVGTANVFEAARRSGSVKKVMYAESSVLEEGDDRLNGFYAISKMADAKIAQGYRAAYGVTSVGLRYFNVYGPRQDYRRTAPPVMSKFIITLLKGESPVIFEGDAMNKRDFVYVDDVNDFHLRCITDDRVNNKTFPLGSGTNYSMVEVLAAIQKILGKNATAVLRPRMPGDPAIATLASIADAVALGWSPKISLEEGLKAMVPYIKAEMEKGNIR